MASGLMKGADTAVRDCMNVKKGESVLILTDYEMDPEIPLALMEAVKKVTKDVEIVSMRPLSRNGEEPDEDIAKLMKSPDVLLVPTTKSLTHTKARRDAKKACVRVATMPGIVRFSLEEGGLTADYGKVRKLCLRMRNAIYRGEEFRITTKKGTDLRMAFGDHIWDIDDGIYHNPGDFGNLPAGEVDTAPNEGTADGIIVFDTMDCYEKGIRMTVEDGFAVEIEGSKRLEEEVERLGKKVRNIAELGIGTNPQAKIIGNVLEDEKVYETVHVAIGNNVSFGGKCDVPFHIDGIILKPTLEVDGKAIIKGGKWLV
ncbi:hypothetical protein A3K63_05380 [Candidatus Micrarchaeota archaeon RBG_16_49_10]|nr:MAG: hypothetical protein A3K63_05380 [Candidatus Micrarchaeota archaeon RBG_16_49_10]